MTGIDVDPKQIAAARSGAARPNLQYEVMATHHIRNWQRAICEMIRVLRPGGYLIYSDFVFPLWLAVVARFIRLVSFPSTSVLQLLVDGAGLVPVYELHHFGKVDVIWRKTENGCEPGLFQKRYVERKTMNAQQDQLEFLRNRTFFDAISSQCALAWRKARANWRQR